MYSKTLHETVGKIISQQRMLSVRNLISVVEVEMDQIQEILDDYLQNQSIRISHAKSCSSGCSTCSTTCSTNTRTTIKESDIIISLLYSRTEENANE